MDVVTKMWNAAPVGEIPSAVLTAWRIYRIEEGYLHFVGFNLLTGKYRVSSAIARFDPTTKAGTTQSGRFYRLAGPPDDSGVSEAV